MANYANVKATLAANIYTNHTGQVTAEMVKTAADEIVNTLIAGGYLYAGVAHPGDAAVSPDANVFYIASEPGTFTNKGGLVVADGEVAVLKYNGSWSKEVTGAATAAQVTELGQKTERIPLQQDGVVLITESSGQNVFPGYVNSSGLIGGTSASMEIYSHLEVGVSGKNYVRFLGGIMESGASSSPRGYAFYDSQDDVIEAHAFEIGTQAGKATKDYFVSVPNGAVSFKTCIKDNTVDFGITVDNFYCYLCTGQDVKDYVDKKVEDAPFVKTADVVNDLLTGGATKVLSAEQGKILNQKIVYNNFDFRFTASTSNFRITELDNLPNGTRLFLHFDSPNLIRYRYTKNGTSAYKDIKPGGTLVIGADGETMDYIQTVTDLSQIHLLINPIQTDNANNPFEENTIGEVNLVGHHTCFNKENVVVASDAGTDIFAPAPIPKIPKGATYHIDFSSDFSSWLSKYRVYYNGSSSYTTYSVQKLELVASEDITSIRVRIANTDIISGQTPQNVSAELWWEDIKMQFDEIKEKASPLINVSKQSFIDANPAGYDSANDKFTEGEYSVILSNPNDRTAISDVIANYTAKYTTSGNSYPYIQLFYEAPPLVQNRRRWKYPVGGNGYYKNNQCKLIGAGTNIWSNSAWNSSIKMVITVPQGCELHLQNITAEFVKGVVNKDAYKVFQHGSDRRADACTRTNWETWPHIGNYGAIAMPKRTTDGVWVCYHDDEFGDSPNVQVKGDPSAPLPATSIQECTYAETQTLEYVQDNVYGDHDTIPTLAEFFAKCAQMGVHPCLSCHPTHISEAEGSTWKFADWAEVRTLAEKYKVLDKLTIKSSWGHDAAANFYAIFGDDIEGAIFDINASSGYTDAQIEGFIDDLASIGWDTDNVKVGFELVMNDAYFSDDVIAYLEANNMVHGVAPGRTSDIYFEAKFLKELIEKGCYEITADYFYSNGLNWA